MNAMAPNGSARVLVVDDQEHNVRLLVDLLSAHGYEVAAARDGHAALAAIERSAPDVVLLDVMMPGLTGIDVCRRLRDDPRYAMLPVILVTALDDSERLGGLDAGADDFLTKPFSQPELLARVRSLVRVKHLFDRTVMQASQLRELNENLAGLVDAKVAEVERLSRLRRFLAPKLAQRILDGGAQDPLVSHRRDIVVVFFDLRGFTSFAEISAPEDVMRVLRDFHEALGSEAQRFGGTIERYTGDGVMVFFNDPEPSPAPCEDAVEFARAVMERSARLRDRWLRDGFQLDVSAGIAYGYATLGQIGFGDRIDYAAIGSVTNLAARLCAEAKGGEILLSARVAESLPRTVPHACLGEVRLKGFREPTVVHRLAALVAG